MASSKDIDIWISFMAIANLGSLLDENTFQEISALSLWIQKMKID